MSYTNTKLTEKHLQFVLKPVGGDQTVLDHVITVSGQLEQLELNKLHGTSGLEQGTANECIWVYFLDGMRIADRK